MLTIKVYKKVLLYKRYFIGFIILAVLLSVLSSKLWAQQTILSYKAQVSLLTVSPGDESYTLFGHSALRIYDPALGIDRTYNYGTFDFDTQGFYWKFALENLQYFLSVNQFENAKNAYLDNRRIITEQRLNLTANQIQRLYDYLQNNAKPENRYYSYEFFYDNCTTRIYDAIKSVTGDSIQFHEPLNPAKMSFRQFINPYLEPVPWVKFGINLLLGATADHSPSGPATLFLPDLLKEGFTEARIQRADTSFSLVAGQTFYAPQKWAVISPTNISPVFSFWFLLVGTVILSFIYGEKRTLWLWHDRILFGSTGLIGLLILFLWIFSSYPSTNWNWNILWSAPALPAFILSLANNKNVAGSSKTFWIIYTAIIFIFMLSWLIIPQQLPNAILPLLLLLGYRNIRKTIRII